MQAVLLLVGIVRKAGAGDSRLPPVTELERDLRRELENPRVEGGGASQVG
jgi:hypothetical protein